MYNRLEIYINEKFGENYTFEEEILGNLSILHIKRKNVNRLTMLPKHTSKADKVKSMDLEPRLQNLIKSRFIIVHRGGKTKGVASVLKDQRL